ncbi:MAG: cache domain-containing protein [Anaerolineales bacterium]|jgi:two-component system NtrC family sensor kinase
MSHFLLRLLAGRMQVVLIGSIVLMVALTLGLNALAISTVIDDYLKSAEAERIDRDMDLASQFYRLKAEDITDVGQRMSKDPRVVQALPDALEGLAEALAILDEEMSRKITVPNLSGTHFIGLLDDRGSIVLGRVLWSNDQLSDRITGGNWGELPIVEHVMTQNTAITATEIIPEEFLSQVGLAGQAFIPLKETPKAASTPYDLREGTAGLALTSVIPIDLEGTAKRVAVIVVYLFNNDFTLVDQIRETAGVDTATVFYGDLRVSTNVPDESGERAVGTRVSQEVFDVVLAEGRRYEGEAFVVNEWYITRYEPLIDHLDQVVGILYVGARKLSFDSLIDAFNQRVIVIAFICILCAAVFTMPISRFITRPIAELVDANKRLSRGDMSVRVQTHGRGELSLLGDSFNDMVEKLDETQKKLFHQEKLASVGQLAAGVAHEINNPLGTILLLTDVMYKETPEDDPHHEDLAVVIEEATRCKTIVADLLNFSRQQDILTTNTDIHALLERVVSDARRKPGLDQIEIVTHLDGDVPKIQADQDQMQQVFTNLLNNAAEAIEGRGRITISTQVENGQWLIIKLADTGCGIPEADMGKLFTPFFTKKASGKGTGLGLSIVYGIVKMHRGQIQVQSKMGEGTSVFVSLPIQHAPDSGR